MSVGMHMHGGQIIIVCIKSFLFTTTVLGNEFKSSDSAASFLPFDKTWQPKFMFSYYNISYQIRFPFIFEAKSTYHVIKFPVMDTGNSTWIHFFICVVTDFPQLYITTKIECRHLI